MANQKATNIIWHQSEVNQAAREELLKQKGDVIWFTGLSGSGKSTIANQVANVLHQLGKLTYVLDGDNIRHGLNKNLGFSPEDREENIRRIGEVAKLFADAGIIATMADKLKRTVSCMAREPFTNAPTERSFPGSRIAVCAPSRQSSKMASS